jgi:prepilin-type processing-associated H-X9-DG protein
MSKSIRPTVRRVLRRVASRPSTCRRGVTLTDVCVLTAVAVLGLAAVLPAVGTVEEEAARRVGCATNLRKIAQAAVVYANDEIRNGGKFPRLHTSAVGTPRVPSFYSGVNVDKALDVNDPRPDGPKDNDVTGAVYHLLKTQKLGPELFVCPSGDAKPLAAAVVPQTSNFPGRASLSYSYSNPYPSKEAVTAGWRFDNSLGPDHPLAADMSYGDSPAGGPTKVAPTSDRKLMATANSANHLFAGQNVAFCDGHVEWQTTPFCGPARPGKAYRDNIYAAEVMVDATGKGGAVVAAPQDAADAVLLPTYLDGPQPKDPPARKPTAESAAEAPIAAPPAADGPATRPGQ